MVNSSSTSISWQPTPLRLLTLDKLGFALAFPAVNAHDPFWNFKKFNQKLEKMMFYKEISVFISKISALR